jgi:predicted nucleic acid-binding protein
MNKTFADTFYYLALLNPGDQAHRHALEVTAQCWGTLITTQWILMEVGDAMSGPNVRQRFRHLIEALEADPGTIVVPATATLFRDGVALFKERLDKSWSLTDCTSFVVMDQQEIKEALTADRHFAQAGFTPLLLETQ